MLRVWFLIAALAAAAVLFLAGMAPAAGARNCAPRTSVVRGSGIAAAHCPGAQTRFQSNAARWPLP